MKTFLISFTLAFLLSFQLQAQTENNLLDNLNGTSNENTDLLPSHFIITQKIMWGEKGLMRNFNRFELTPEKRQRELKLRRTMLVTHQVMGFVTLGGMVAQGIVGAKLYNGKTNLKGTHEALAAGVNIGYFTTTSLSLFAPPKMVNERKGYSSIKLHKALAIIHLSSMIATNILAGQVESNPNLTPYHRAAAFTAFGSFAVSMMVIKF
ncbi:MAG: hypothetical protein JW729_01125 [Bacteroidales bacterium]|nr:hypothetical protein [Bacteroidales bacterium]